MSQSSDRAAKRIIEGKSWSDFCDLLKAAGQVIISDDAPDDAFTRAEGFRYLSRVTRAALQTFVEHSDPRAPVLQRVVHETAKMGSDNPDNYYQNAAISGEYEYRIRGQRGTVNYLGFGTQIGHYGQGAGMPPTGYLEAADMTIEPDGSFEIWLSCEPKEGNWLPMTKETGTLIVRQTFLDRDTEKAADLRIDRVGGETSPSPFTPESIDGGLQTSAMLVGGAARIFHNWAVGFQAHTNELPRFSDELSRSYGGDPNIAYYHSYWRLADDEALVIDVTPPKCENWNFQLNNHWMESLDYRYFNIHVNKHTATYRADGSVRIVVAHEDPGEDNWINTVGHSFGTMCFRWIRAAEHPQPKTRVVKLSALQAGA